MPHINVFCKRCQCVITLPDLSEEDRMQVVSFVRAGPHARAVQLLHTRGGLDLLEAKAVEMHITRTPGTCVRCRRQLHGRGETECESCGSLALDW